MIVSESSGLSLGCPLCVCAHVRAAQYWVAHRKCPESNHHSFFNFETQSQEIAELPCLDLNLPPASVSPSAGVTGVFYYTQLAGALLSLNSPPAPERAANPDGSVFLRTPSSPQDPCSPSAASARAPASSPLSPF